MLMRNNWEICYENLSLEYASMPMVCIRALHPS